MSRENLLFAIIGILFGFIVGFMSASVMNQKYGPVPATVGNNQALPSDHPPIGSQAASSNPQGMQAEVMASIEKARKEPKNFEAQLKAAELKESKSILQNAAINATPQHQSTTVQKNPAEKINKLFNKPI